MQKLIEGMKRSKMTEGEKARLKSELLAFIETAETSPIKGVVASPYWKRFGVPSYFRFSFASIGKAVAVSALSLLLVLGGLTYASASALPGDWLYPIKIHLKEGIEDKLLVFAFTPAEKIALRERRVEERFTELEQLVKKNRVTPENLSIANSEIQVEKKKIKSDLEKINADNPQAAEQAKKDLNSSITARENMIGKLIEAKAASSTDSGIGQDASPTDSGIGQPSSPTDSGINQETSKTVNGTKSEKEAN